MLSAVSILVILSIGLIQAIHIVEESCAAEVSTSSSSCDGLIFVDNPCNESTADLTPTSLKSCDKIDLTWMYPMRNLTITIETSYTQQQQPYAIQFQNSPFYSSRFHLYRILDGQETRINSSAQTVVEKSDSNYQVILQIQAPLRVSLYLLSFGYSVTKS